MECHDFVFDMGIIKIDELNARGATSDSIIRLKLAGLIKTVCYIYLMILHSSDKTQEYARVCGCVCELASPLFCDRFEQS